MSQLDVVEAKRALAKRLQLWLEDDDLKNNAYLKASGFIDELVIRGWIMDPLKEGRPAAPKRNEACLTCGKHLESCTCGEMRTTPTRTASHETTREAIAGIRKALKGAGSQ